MPTFLDTLLRRLGLAHEPPAIEAELLATVRPPPVDALADLPPAPPTRPVRRKVRVARQRTLADLMRENQAQMGARLAAGEARLDAIYNPLSRLGGSSDKGAAALPDTSRVPLELAHLDVLYRYSAYGRRVVDIVPDEETRRGWKIVDGTQRVDALAEEEKRLHISSAINRARKWARHAGGSLIFLVTDEEQDPRARTPSEQLRYPLDLARVKRLRNLLVVDRTEASPATWDGDVQSPTFGEPLTWWISPGTAGALTSGGKAIGGGSLVHASRVIAFAGRRLPRRLRLNNGGWDDSVLESCWDAIRHLTSVDQGAALIAQEWQVKVMKVKGLAGLQTSDQALAFYTKLQQMATSMSMLNMSVIDQDEELTSLASTTTGFEELSSHARTELATAADMPQVLLFGEAPSGLNTDGESWRRHHAQSIAASQETELRDPLERIYRILYAQTEGPTAGREPARWDLVFEPLEQLTEDERAQIRLAIAQADAAYVSAGVLDPEHVAKSRFGRDGWSDDILPVPTAEGDGVEAEAADALARARAILTGSRVDADAYTVPAGAQGNARKVLRWRDEHPDQIQGMTATGWARARQLADGGTISRGDMVEIAAWFARHGAQAGTKAVAAEYADEPWRDAGYVSWLGWGGDTMASYAEEARSAMARTDAGEVEAWVCLPVPDGALPMLAQLRTAAEGITGPLEQRGEPHVTLLFVGPLAVPLLPALIDAAEEAVEHATPARLAPVAVRTLGDGEPGAAVPVVVEVDGWELGRVNDALLRRCAHLVSAPQHGRFIAHVTLGWAPSLTPDQRGRLGELPVPRDVTWTAARVEVRHGGIVAMTIPLEGRTDGAAD